MRASVPKDWTQTPLGEVADISLGRTPARKRQDYWENGEVPWVSIADMTSGVVLATKEQISRKAHEEVFRGHLVPEGALLMSFKLTIGRTAVLGIPAVHNEAIAYLKPKSDAANRDFLRHQLASLDYSPYLDPYVKGQTLNKQKLRALQVALPPESEQGEIVRVLAAIEKSETASARAIKATEQLRTSAARHLFSYGPVARKDLAEIQLEESPVGPLPRHWRSARLADLATTASGGTPSRNDASNFGGSIPWVKSGELRDGVVTATEETISDKGLATSSAKLFPAGTLLVAMYGATAGQVGLLNMEATTNQAVCAVFPNGDVTARYLFFALRHRRRELLGERYGGAQPNVSQGLLRNFRLPVPPLGEQEEIVEILRSIEASLNAETQVAAALAEVFRIAQSGLVKGAIRLQGVGK